MSKRRILYNRSYISVPMSVRSLKLEAVKKFETEQLEASWETPTDGSFTGFNVSVKIIFINWSLFFKYLFTSEAFVQKIFFTKFLFVTFF